MSEDPRLSAARYRAERAAADTDAPDAASASDDGESRPDAATRPSRGSTAQDRAAYVETAIQRAIRRGEFDDLPGAGKPIPGLGDHHDPDWWIRRKIQSEQLSGLGPPALLLRVEDAELEERLDVLAREQDVREAVEDFNRRVVEARRQLLGGPPVVTPTRDVAAEVDGWRERRAARLDAASARADAPTPPRRWWRRSSDG